MKAGLYIRISTGEQSKFSLEAQEDQLRAYCKSRGIEVYKVYQDIKGRFSFEERSGLMQILDDVEKNKIDYILVTELDRLAGDEGIIGYIRYTLKKNDVKLIAINEENKVANELQELTDSILSAVARFENKRKKLRCLRGIAKAREQGKTLNRCPFGYKILNKGKRDSQIVADEDKSKIVIEIFDRVANKGESVYRVAKDLNLSKSNVRYILQNQFYCSGDYNGEHNPIISKEIFGKVNSQNIA